MLVYLANDMCIQGNIFFFGDNFTAEGHPWLNITLLQNTLWVNILFVAHLPVNYCVINCHCLASCQVFTE